MSANQMAIHTSSGCTQSGTDCSQGAGCTVGEKSDGSYGSAFASAGGGVWATQFDTTGIKSVFRSLVIVATLTFPKFRSIWFWSVRITPGR